MGSENRHFPFAFFFPLSLLPPLPCLFDSSMGFAGPAFLPFPWTQTLVENSWSFFPRKTRSERRGGYYILFSPLLSL